MKNDIKYIIKKIIIGVGIAIGVMLVKSLPVFAEEKKDIAICQAGRNSGMTWFSQQNDCSKYLSGAGYISDSSFTEIVSYDFPFYTSATFHFKYEVSTKRNQLIFYDEKNDTYMFIGISSKYKEVKIVSEVNGANKPYYYFMGRTSTSESFSTLYYSSLVVVTSKSHTIYEDLYELNKTNASGDNYFEKQIYENGNDKIYIYGAQLIDISSLYLSYSELDYGLSILDLKNNKLISSGFDKVYFGDDIKDVEEIKEFPDGYEMIDMLGKDVVLFYPKDFRNIDNVCSETSSIIGGSAAMCNQFDYYYTFYLKGSFDTALKNLGLNSSEFDRVSLENYPKATEYTKIVKSNYYDTGILFYPTNISSGTGSVASSEYKVYYDSSKLNYIIIDNIDDFTGEDISYIDKNGDEVSTKIDSVKKRTDIEYSGSDDFNVDYDENSIKSFDISSGFKSFINMLSDGVSFFKKYMGEFMKDIPQFVFYFVIFIPILSIVVAVLKIINR